MSFRGRSPRERRAGRYLLILLVLAGGLLVACGAQSKSVKPGPGRTRTNDPLTSTVTSPTLLQEDLVTGSASSYPSANDWGAQGDRLVRTSNGDLYTTYVTGGASPEEFGWVLAKRSAGATSWQVVASGATAHEPGNPPQVLLGPTGTVFVIAISPWNSTGQGAPEIWDSVSRTTTVIPGRWLTGAKMENAGALYPSASIDTKGNIYVWEDVPCTSFIYANGTSPRCHSANIPGTYYWAYRTASDGQWHAEEWQSSFRQTYNFLLPDSNSAFRVVGTRDILQAPAEAPYTCRNGTGYCFDQTILVRWTDLDRPASSVLVARAAQYAPGYAGDVRASAEDAYVDTDGRTQILVSAVDARTGGADQNRHLVIDSTGKVTDIEYSGVPYANLSRIVQDLSGRLWIYSVGPDPANGHSCDVFIRGGVQGDTDGTKLGPLTVLRLSPSYDCSSEERNFDVSVRSGTARADYIDGVVGTNDGRDWLHYRIGLPGYTDAATNPDPATSGASASVAGAGTAPASPRSGSSGASASSIGANAPSAKGSADRRPTPGTTNRLTIVSRSPLRPANADTPYRYQLIASGGQAPYTWSIVAGGGGPPAGMSLAPDGVLSGTAPTSHEWRIPGSFSLDVEVRDAEGRIAQRPFWLSVEAAPAHQAGAG